MADQHLDSYEGIDLPDGWQMEIYLGETYIDGNETWRWFFGLEEPWRKDDDLPGGALTDHDVLWLPDLPDDALGPFDTREAAIAAGMAFYRRVRSDPATWRRWQDHLMETTR